MNVIAKDFASKAVVALVAAAMFLSIAAPAKAQTAEELQAMINNLLAQIAALQAGGGTTTGTTTGFQFTRDLGQGSTGADVLELQKFLNTDPDTRVAATGAGSVGQETSFYGPATAAAVSKFQVKYRADILTPSNLVNPTGYFGPSSRAKANALNTTTTGGGDTTDGEGALKGDEADVRVKSVTSGSIGIDLGKADVVLAAELDVRDSDISVSRVDVEFDARPWLYFKEVNLLVDGKEVESLTRSSDFSSVSGGKYRARFANLDTIIRDGKKAEVAIEVVVADAMSAARQGDIVNVTMDTDSIRFVDAKGITDTDGVDISAAIGFDTAWGTLKATVSDESPENATIVLEKTSRTNNVEVAVATLKAEDNDVEVTDIEVALTTGTSTLDVVLARVRAFDGNKELANAVVDINNATGTVVLEDVDLAIKRGDTKDVRIELEFNRADNYLGSRQDTITVNTVKFVAENADYEDASKTVNYTETHTIVSEGLVAKIKSITSASSNEGKTVTFTYKMDVTAYGEDFYINDATSAITGVTTVLSAGSASTTHAISSNATKVGGQYRINEDQTREVTVSVAVSGLSGATSAFVKATLGTLVYDAGTVTLGAPDFESDNAAINI